jgi:hypothetical protein
LPCAIDTSIWRSTVTICSALNLFFGMTSSFPSYSLTTLGLKKPGQVTKKSSGQCAADNPTLSPIISIGVLQHISPESGLLPSR